MSGTASGSRVQLTYLGETTQGTTPSVTPGDTQIIRTTGRNINLTKNPLTSNEVYSDRMIRDVRHGFRQAGGTIPFELSRSTYDDLLLWTLSDSAWNAVSMATADLAVTAGTSTITRATGSFITDGFRIGDIILTASFTNSGNNGTFRVTAVTALTLVVHDINSTLVDESSASGRTITMTGRRADIGTTLKTFSLQRAFTDITQYQVFTGCAINTLDLSIQPEQIVSGSFGLIGLDASASGSALDSSPTAATTTSPFSAFDGRLYEGGSQLGIVTSMQFTLNNNRSVDPRIFYNTSECVYEGSVSITGTMTAYFQNLTLYNKFLNETESSLWMKLNDINGTDFMNFVFPRIKYTTADIDPPQNGPIVMPMAFTALYDTTSGTMMSIQKSNT